ncbi:MAG: DPP IV N-terminal domain-containing protein [Chloroflexi bacterium]|nr:DPP IV N-terminal domain-containing protein [Chloroflexota bacterium]MDA1226724.1 DPP IV N-terminal domain-containing protein [Chloroflexota bacterium]
MRILLAIAGVLVLTTAACGPPTPSIFFASDRDGNMEIYSINASSGEAVNLTNSTVNESNPVVSPDGSLVAFQAGTDVNNAIEVITMDGKTRTRMTQSGGGHKDHRWSPSSSRLAYVLQNGQEPTIYVANTDGSNPVKLTSVPGDDVGGWSGDGNSVVFVVRDVEGQGLYLRNPDGVNERRLTDTPDYGPVWSPNSRKLAFLSTRDGNPEIYVMNADGSGQVRITETDEAEFSPTWSPDGRKLLFVSERDGNAEIYVSDARGTDVQRLTQNGAKDVQPVWSPDGNQIAFVSYLDGDADIVVMNTDGSNQSRLTNNSDQDIQPSW